MCDDIERAIDEYRRKKRKQRYQANKDAINEKARTRRKQLNSEELEEQRRREREYMRAWRKAHPEKVKEAARKVDKDKERLHHKKYHEAHREERLEYFKRRRREQKNVATKAE